ncbi:transporter substrate-binding domain-containing protein [Pseudoalteromonas sp. MMG022]|uniref:substrate-binding periplasmic protein n=1 Tax=Pseudoalteromonas sp. MMG022 TaxID=2909978 RepID=UPI001F2DEE4C|nr:transporter substrate-binding domain-containing protein [Pseudoalteromonas sp. MMG022]MCF6433945.1 transporter substrate-binding domain-containing protein [Pseudoalteromonas sp. MMG022]
MKYIILFLLHLSFTCFAQQYHFAAINHLIEQEVGRIVLTEVYQQLGIQITITPLPARRAHYKAAMGSYDGEIMRIYSYGEETPSVTRVPTPYYYLETMVFTRKDSGIVINTANDLSRYQVVKVRGVKHTQNITRGMENVTDTDNTAQMLRLVNTGLADVALTNKMDGLVTLRSLGISGVVAHPKSLNRQTLYHYIRNEHVELINKVDCKLKELQQSGELDKLIERAEQQVFKLKANHTPTF